jgi:hypothetical protein
MMEERGLKPRRTTIMRWAFHEVAKLLRSLFLDFRARSNSGLFDYRNMLKVKEINSNYLNIGGAKNDVERAR